MFFCKLYDARTTEDKEVVDATAKDFCSFSKVVHP